jgi:arylsulfatase A
VNASLITDRDPRTAPWHFFRRTRLLAWCLVFLGCLLASWGVGAERAPNIIFILADDLGYGDIGAFGQRKIRTPHLDRMAAEGMRFTQHYAGNAVCAPSRCVLLTGKHPGHAWIRDNREVQPEGQPPLPANTMTIAKLLQQKGYATAAMGKWGLGFPGSEGEPLKQGFDRFFGYNCQRQAHNYYPTSLWDNAQRIKLRNPAFEAHQKFPADADPGEESSYARYTGKDYAPDLIAEQALAFIRANRTRSFFLYFATTIPHLALQVPEDSLAEYRGQFGDRPYLGTNNYLPHLHPRAAYAALITRLDREIGRMMALVRELGLDDNTIFIFTSDNGPLYDRLGGTDTEFFNSAAGLRGRKGSLYEGGVRVPLIARWKGHIATNAASDRVTGFEDWLPTLLELSGGGGAPPPGMDGISFAATLLGKAQAPRSFLYREFPAYNGWQSVRSGDWKALRKNLNPRQRAIQPNLTIELYNLKDDPSESKDVAAAHPEVVSRAERIMAGQHERSALFPFRALDALR